MRPHLPALLCLLLFGTGAHAQCEATVWRTYRGTTLMRFPGSTAYFYVTSRMAIDADGAPNAYHPDDTGIDANRNAGYPNGGWRNVLVVDPRNRNRPYVQPSGDFAGYFVSKTTLQDRTLPETDPRRYVDSRNVPYLVFPGAFFRLSGTGLFGDIGAAYNLSNGRATAAIVADAGPRTAPLGEVSIGLAEGLGGTNVNPRNGSGMPTGPFLYVLFPRSLGSPPWPVAPAQLQARSDALLAEIGGWARVRACVP